MGLAPEGSFLSRFAGPVGGTASTFGLVIFSDYLKGKLDAAIQNVPHPKEYLVNEQFIESEMGMLYDFSLVLVLALVFIGTYSAGHTTGRLILGSESKRA